MNRSFEDELSDLINRHNKDSEANTPDFILAKYLTEILEEYIKSIQSNRAWQGVDVVEKVELGAK